MNAYLFDQLSKRRRPYRGIWGSYLERMRFNQRRKLRGQPTLKMVTP